MSENDYDFIKSRAGCNIFELMEKMVLHYISEAGIKKPPVPNKLISLLDKQRSIKIQLIPLRVCNGALWSFDDQWVIHLRCNDNYHMRRFVLFHEAFHILLRRNYLPNLKQKEIPRGTFSEYLADAFASYILLPEKLVKEKWEKVRDINIMSNIFKVPKTTVCIRLRRLGLI